MHEAGIDVDPLPADWLLDRVELRIYHAFGVHRNEIAGHQVRYLARSAVGPGVAAEDLFALGEPRSPVDSTAAVIVILLAGDFYSLDSLRLKTLSADDTRLTLEMQRVRVESQDGDPARVDPYLFLLLNESVTRRQQLAIRFESIQKDFEGREGPGEGPHLPPLDLLLERL